ncbi:MAG: phage capsid protein, partial [Candidatus Baldrarchaeia archaeon]
MAVPQIGSLEAASELFKTEVTTKYQNTEKLGYTIEERHGTSGTTLNVPVSDEIEMNQGNFAPTDIPVTPVEETNVPIVAKDFRLKTVIGGGEETLFNYDKIVTHARLHAKASGRMNDFVKLSAIFGNPTALAALNARKIPVNVGVNTGINQGKMSEALSFLEAQGIDDMDMYNISMW